MHKELHCNADLSIAFVCFQVSCSHRLQTLCGVCSNSCIMFYFLYFNTNSQRLVTTLPFWSCFGVMSDLDLLKIVGSDFKIRRISIEIILVFCGLVNKSRCWHDIRHFLGFLLLGVFHLQLQTLSSCLGILKCVINSEFQFYLDCMRVMGNTLAVLAFHCNTIAQTQLLVIRAYLL